MRYLILFLVSMGFVAPVQATLDPDPDQIGIYFDTNADEVCLNVPPALPFLVYVVVTNPSAAEIMAVEFSLCEEVPEGMEGLLFRLSPLVWPDGCIGPINPEFLDFCEEGMVFGCPSPFPQVGAKAVILGLQYMILADISVDFYLGPAAVQSIDDGLPAYLDGNDVARPLGLSSGSPDLPVASVNGDCNVVPIEQATFERLKCLYR